MGGTVMTMIRARGAVISGAIFIHPGHGYATTAQIIEMNVEGPRRVADERGEEQ